MKIIQLNHISHLRSITLILGFALISVNQAQSLDSMIAFSSDRDSRNGKYDIFVMKANGTQVRNLTNNPMSSDNAPAWSPDRTKIAFHAVRDGINPEIYVMNADGENPVQITVNRGFDVDPSWSSDGRKIAFETDRDRFFEDGKIRILEIYVVDPDGDNRDRITRNPNFPDKDPSWSPDGRKIAFASVRDRNWEIYVMNANGNNLVRLTRHRAEDHGPTWSPDGRKIAFASVRDRNWEIYVMDADGGNPTNLTQHPADDISPAWPPNPLTVSPKTQLLVLWATIKTSR